MALDLTKACLPDNDAALDDLQCNTLAPHRRNLSVHLFFNLGLDAAKNRQYLQDWAARVTPLSAQVSEENLRRETRKDYIKRGFASANWPTKAARMAEFLFAPSRAARHRQEELALILEKFWREKSSARSLVKSVMLSSSAIMKLDPWNNGNRAHVLPVKDRPWQLGMFGYEPTLAHSGNGHQKNWVFPFFDQNHPLVRQTVDIHVILAVDGAIDPGQAQPKPDRLLQAIADEKRLIADAGGTFRDARWAYLCRHPTSGFQEHFGFRDGISNVHVLEGEIAFARKKFSSAPARTTLANLLYELKLPSGQAAYGTLCVLRQIEESLVNSANLTAGLVGRQSNGTPLVAAAGVDGFDFLTDAAAPPPPPACPFHAHIRKANPRGTSNEVGEAARLMARRGMLYGSRAFNHDQHAFGAAAGPVGLLFLGYMAGIESQFVHTQKNWLAPSLFPRHAGQPDAFTGDPSLKHPAGLTTMRGGEYYFVPPLSWLRDPRPPPP